MMKFKNLKNLPHQEDELSDLIKKNYEEGSYEENIFDGIFETQYDYNLGYGLKVNSDTFLEAQQSSLRRNILDIGTGMGGFIDHAQKKFSKFNVYGITGKNLVDQEKLSKDPQHYLVGNIEFLDEMENLDLSKMTDVFSSKTFIHLTDPLGTLKKIYDKLPVGANIIIDVLPIPGLSKDECEGLVKYLNKHGYQVSASHGNNGLTGVLIQKTEPQLKLPLSYGKFFTTEDKETRIEYKASHRLDKYLPIKLSLKQVDKIILPLEEIKEVIRSKEPLKGSLVGLAKDIEKLIDTYSSKSMERFKEDLLLNKGLKFIYDRVMTADAIPKLEILLYETDFEELKEEDILKLVAVVTYEDKLANDKRQKLISTLNKFGLTKDDLEINEYDHKHARVKIFTTRERAESKTEKGKLIEESSESEIESESDEEVGETKIKRNYR